MKSVPREAWWYGGGLILLFSMSAVATVTVIHTVDRLIDTQDYLGARQVSMIGTWLLTLGFMFLSAGLGMWAIQYASFRTSLRRLGSFIDAMDYLHDGLLALNSKAQVINANPVARRLTPVLKNPNAPLGAAFPCLNDADIAVLSDGSGPHEVERETIGEAGIKTLRFRSQPAPDIQLILISDVTVSKAQEARQREAARLQLIGRISRGVADDFNRILSVISGQTGLLTRLTDGREGATQAANEIYRAVQAGSNLASHLLDLSRAESLEATTDYVEEDLRRAVELLRLALPTGWTVVGDIGKDLPPVNMSGSQIEQAVMNLGLICCDALWQPGTVKISARVPGSDHLDSVSGHYAFIILVSASNMENDTLLDLPPADARFTSIQEESGAVLTVVRSAIEESGGRLDCFEAEHAVRVFRMAVPMARSNSAAASGSVITPALQKRLAGKSILLALAPGRNDDFEKQARTLDLRVVRASDTMTLLAGIEREAFDILVLDRRLIEPEPAVMLRALSRLRPGLPLVILGHVPRLAGSTVTVAMRFVSPAASPAALFEAVAELIAPDGSSKAQVVDQTNVA